MHHLYDQVLLITAVIFLVCIPNPEKIMVYKKWPGHGFGCDSLLSR